MRTLRDVDATTIKHMLQLVAGLRGVSRTKLVEQLIKRGAPVASTDGVAKRKGFEPGFIAELEKMIGEMKPHEQAFIHFELNPESVQGLSKEDLIAGGPALKALQTWLKVDLKEMSRFIGNCTNANGRYLLLRMVEEDKLTSISASEMRVSAPAGNGLLPTFTTTRGAPANRTVNGAIFQSGETVYAIGQIWNDPGIRFSRLVFRPRGASMDLYGLRCGHSDNRPFAYLLYAYQIAPDDERDLSRFLKATDPDDPVFKELEDFERIRELIEAKGLEEGGLLSHKLS